MKTTLNNRVDSPASTFSVREEETKEKETGIVGETIRVSFFPEEPEYREGDSYDFQMTVENNSPEKVFHFYSYDEPFQQFSFTLKREHQNTSMKKLNYYRFLYDHGRFSDRHKTIALGYRESYSRSVSLGDFFQFDYPGLYEITGDFYPLGVNQPEYKIPIQPFVLRIHPRHMGSSELSKLSKSSIPGLINGSANLKNRIDGNNRNSVINTDAPRRLTPLFPNEVVEDHFQRIRTHDYRGYLNNLELDKILVNSYQSSEEYFRYVGAEVYEKKVIIEDFKNFLIEKIDYTLVDSSVLKTSVIGETAVVEAVMAIREPFENYHQGLDINTGELQTLWAKEPVNRLERYYYLTFDLEMISGLNSKPWKIIGYEAQNLSAQQYQNYKSHMPNQPESLIIKASKTDQEENNFLEKVIHFGYNLSVVEEDELVKIKKLAQFLIAYPGLRIELYGHTDSRGREDYNYKLSEKRVESVMSLLVSAGVGLDRIRFFYKGESEPLNPGNTEEERRLNRRVEIKIYNPQP